MTRNRGNFRARFAWSAEWRDDDGVLVAGLAARRHSRSPRARATAGDASPPLRPTEDVRGEISLSRRSVGDEIVVTGYRLSLSASLNEKRNAAGVIDVIKAEDIADFPDNNLAESIQRIPGVAITRDQGEGRNISVRGLSPSSPGFGSTALKA